MRDALLPAFLLTIGLAGCATYHAEPIEPATLAQRFALRSLAGDRLHAWFTQALGHEVEPWPPARWNRESLTLAAWYYSPALDVARAQWHTAEAGIDVADAIPNPVLQLPFEYATPNPGPGAPFTTGPALDIPIETAGKRGYRVDEATHLAQSARLSIANEAWKVRAQVRDAMLALYAARERSAYLSEAAGARRQIVEMVEKRRAVGETSGAEVDAARHAALQADNEFAAARNAQQDARARLAAAIGVPLAALDAVTLDLDEFRTPPPPPPARDAQLAAVFERADLRASLADYAAAESALQLEVAKQYPDLHLGPGYSYDTGTHRIAFGLTGITLPIFDQNQAGIAQAEAKRKEAAARTEALQDAMLGELERTCAQYQSARLALQRATGLVAIADRQLRSEAQAFAAGNADRVVLMQAKADYAASEVAHLDAAIAAHQAADALEDAMQRPIAVQTEQLTRAQAEREVRR
jgi:outer membrane protein TolC